MPEVTVRKQKKRALRGRASANSSFTSKKFLRLSRRTSRCADAQNGVQLCVVVTLGGLLRGGSFGAKSTKERGGAQTALRSGKNPALDNPYPYRYNGGHSRCPTTRNDP